MNFNRWNTSSYGGSADTTPSELDELSAHLQRCRGSRAMANTLCVSNAMDQFLSRHVITTLVGLVGCLLLIALV